MSKVYLVADPCHIISRDDWSSFLDVTNFAEEAENYHIPGVGTILECKGTGGDGSWEVAPDKFVGVDAGLVSIIELNADSAYSDSTSFEAVTEDYDEAKEWFEAVTY